MATSMKNYILVVCTPVVAVGLCNVVLAQANRPQALWNELKERPTARRPDDSVDSSRFRENKPAVAAKDNAFPIARRSSIQSDNAPKRFPSINEQKSDLEQTQDREDGQWWETEANADANYARGNQPHQSDGRGDLITSSQIVAIVGNEPILAGDLLGRINEALQPYMGQASEEELAQKRWELIEQLLPSSIEAKMVYLDFVRKMKPEQINALRANIYSQFDEKQLPELVEKAGVRNITELEAKMRAVGASLDKTRRLFFEQVAAREVIRRGGEIDREISPAELLAFYRERIDEYQIPAKAKWEQLTVKVPTYASDEERRRAELRLGKMGNAVLAGTPFATVAKRDSDGITAHEGGKHDWTIKGSLVSNQLDEQIFSLPIATMSDIIEDETGFHIVRVLERKEAGYTPFTEAQKGIRDKIIEEARNEKVADYLADLKDRTYVWNYFETKTAEHPQKPSRF